MLGSGLRSPIRGVSSSGTLEAVQESPEASTSATEETKELGHSQSAVRPSATVEKVKEDTATISGILSESGSESGGNKKTGMNPPRRNSVKTTGPPLAGKLPSVQPRRSYTQLNSARIKPVGEVATRNITMETEIVSSIPQVAASGIGERVTNRAEGATLRLKPSSETMKPRKEKKKAVRKAPSITSGTGGSSNHSFCRYHHTFCQTCLMKVTLLPLLLYPYHLTGPNLGDYLLTRLADVEILIMSLVLLNQKDIQKLY